MTSRAIALNQAITILYVILTFHDSSCLKMSKTLDYQLCKHNTNGTHDIFNILTTKHLRWHLGNVYTSCMQGSIHDIKTGCSGCQLKLTDMYGKSAMPKVYSVA